jgi:hypothetical protein
MRHKVIGPWIFAAMAFLILVVPLGRVVAQCGGYCATSGTCPQTGYGCNPNVCCYCCYTCQTQTCFGQWVSCLKSNGTAGTSWATTTFQEKWYNCYTGANCTYSGAQSTVVCNYNVCTTYGPCI